jgi:pilus assembly protein Flp/PilA
MRSVSSTQSGQGLVEYALIFAFVVLVVIVLLYLFGPAVGNMYSEIISRI